MGKSKVIVVSGVTAGGKTTLIQELSKNKKNCFIISFDDYSIDALPTAPSFELFLENAKKAINQYDISLLMDDFLEIKNQYEIIFIDFPFGYEHEVLKPYIDRVVYLKTPLDIAFARQIVRDYSDYDKDSILNWANCYLKKARPIFIEHEKVVSESADLILDGSLPLSEQGKQLKKQFGI